ncbi:transcriptional adapter 2-alpha [Trichonephila inaurata madagascariensis]|uniref:Transcriptional adapter n=1 Tax=Trichonephila inaurata madagascariensis TaxID=2747483 RepID=A0A8X6I8H3_9ARAC|nr:transcriptional adapter 2-alpha [Trichonephila inaurata madagascariensis]
MLGESSGALTSSDKTGMMDIHYLCQIIVHACKRKRQVTKNYTSRHSKDNYKILYETNKNLLNMRLIQSMVRMEDSHTCPICGIFLQEPYIHCTECNSDICLQCFAKGKEYGEHKNDHQYSVMRNNFVILNSDWMAYEEVKLLNAVADHGIGNWSEIAKDVGTKNRVECEEHYFLCYVHNHIPSLPGFQLDKSNTQVYHPTPVTCTSFSQDPPRPIVGSTLYQEMAGYMPCRGDFSYEHDDFAELDIKDLKIEDNDPWWNALQFIVLNIYQSRLKERVRRKWLIRLYGLLNVKRNHEDSKRYAALGSPYLDHVKPLMHLFTPDKYYKFLEGLLWEYKAKQRIRLLKECRSAGITRTHSISTFLKLKKKREERKKRTKTTLDEMLSRVKDESSCQSLIRKQVLKDGISEVGPGRRAAPPLNIATMPGFEKLNSKERDLCSSLRIIPSAYLQYKATLVNEYRKLGSLRLANARSVIKIDVNKTRKIYDLLLEEGLISKT